MHSSRRRLRSALGARIVLLTPELGDLQLKRRGHCLDGAPPGRGVGSARFSVISMFQGSACPTGAFANNSEASDRVAVRKRILNPITLGGG